MMDILDAKIVDAVLVLLPYAMETMTVKMAVTKRTVVCKLAIY